MRLILPLKAVSINKCWRTGKGNHYLTEEVKNFREGVAWYHKAQYVNMPMFTGPVQLFITFIFKDKRRRDLNNCEKALLDALRNVLYVDDVQIAKCASSIYRGTGKDGIVVDIEECKEEAVPREIMQMFD